MWARPGSQVVRVYGSGHEEAYGMALMISFVPKLKGWIERIDGDELWDCLSFVVMLEGGVMHGVK